MTSTVMLMCNAAQKHKKKDKITKRTEVEEEEAEAQEAPAAKHKKNQNSGYMEEEELENSPSRGAREAIQQPGKVRPEPRLSGTGGPRGGRGSNGCVVWARRKGGLGAADDTGWASGDGTGETKPGGWREGCRVC